MPVQTATPARIRRSIRESEFARASNVSVLTAYPAAQDGWANVQESFWNDVADAQILLNERATILFAKRSRIATEVTKDLALPITPVLPRMQAIDAQAGLDKAMMVRGIAKDVHTGRTAVELIG